MSLVVDRAAAEQLNLTVLRRIDPDVEEVLMTAAALNVLIDPLGKSTVCITRALASGPSHRWPRLPLPHDCSFATMGEKQLQRTPFR